MVTKSASQRTSPGPKRRRLAVTLDADSWAALDRLSAAGGMAASQFVGMLVAESQPVILGLAESFEKAKKSPADAIEAMRQVADAALLRGAQQSLYLDKQVKRRKLRKARSR